MDWDERAQQRHSDQSYLWSAKFNKARASKVAQWVSSAFRDGQPCKLIDNLCGSFNWSCVLRFEDGERWLVRFAVPGRVMNGDEKVRNEVATMSFIRTQTNIPVPAVIHWGLSTDNPLDLGAFIVMEFMEGKPLNKFLEESPRPGNSRPILRADIKREDQDIIYRQIAGFLLEISKHDFPRIGSLAGVDGHYDIQSRPLTIKMNEIESHGGVQVGGHTLNTFTSTTEYFHHVADQDDRHLQEQPNSTDNGDDAKSKYACRKAFRSLIPRYTSDRYNRGPFKLIVEDFRFGNMLVNNYSELKIVAVLDWEWTYAGPYQMLFSPPRWLLMRLPIDWERSQAFNWAERYMSHFRHFIQILQEEEEKRDMVNDEKMSSLMRQSIDDGKFWFHELVYSCFEGAQNAAWTAIRRMTSDFDDVSAVSPAELDAFVEKKMAQSELYEQDWQRMKQERQLFLGEIAKTTESNNPPTI